MAVVANGKFVLAGDRVGIIHDSQHKSGISVHFLMPNGETLLNPEGKAAEEYFAAGDLLLLPPNDKRIPESRRG